MLAMRSHDSCGVECRDCDRLGNWHRSLFVLNFLSQPHRNSVGFGGNTSGSPSLFAYRRRRMKELTNRE